VELTSNNNVPETIFVQPWWLDAVAPGRWHEIVITKDNRRVARWPYVIKKRLGFTFITMPVLTPHLGPWLFISAQKYANRLAEEKELVNELVDKLPRFDFFRQRFHHSVTNWLPFYWQGFQQTTHYTYVIDLSVDLDIIWKSFRENARRQIRKAGKQVVVRDDLGIERFMDINELSFKRQRTKPPYTRELVQRVDAACEQHGAQKIFFAEGADRRIHAAAYIGWDSQSAYYLMGGLDPELRSSGAMSLLMWEAIKFAAQRTKRFDFEGSMIEPVERFFRSFGAVQTPYFQITKINSLALRLGTEIKSWWDARKIG